MADRQSLASPRRQFYADPGDAIDLLNRHQDGVVVHEPEAVLLGPDGQQWELDSVELAVLIATPGTDVRHAPGGGIVVVLPPD